MKLLVTGGTGFLGQAIVREAKFKKHVVSLCGRKALADIANIPCSLEDLAVSQSDCMQAIIQFKPDAVLHLAWGKASNQFRDDPYHFDVNLAATKNLVNLIHEKLPQTAFIGIGSQAEYGVVNQILEPNTGCEPIVGYGKAKKNAGEYALATLGERACWLRLLTAYGPGDDSRKFIPYVASSFLQNQAPEVSACEQIWDFLHVNDAAKAIVMAAEQKLNGLHVLCSGEETSFKKIVMTLKTAFEQRRGFVLPAPLFGARPYAEKELFYLVGNPNTIKKALSWSPTISIHDGLNYIVKLLMEKP